MTILKLIHSMYEFLSLCKLFISMFAVLVCLILPSCLSQRKEIHCSQKRLLESFNLTHLGNDPKNEQIETELKKIFPPGTTKCDVINYFKKDAFVYDKRFSVTEETDNNGGKYLNAFFSGTGLGPFVQAEYHVLFDYNMDNEKIENITVNYSLTGP